jgi:hypothetical protein
MGLSLRRPTAEFRALPLEVHARLAGVPLRDVSAIDLPGGGPGRTLADLQTLVPMGQLTAASRPARALFALRTWLGRLLGWDGGGGFQTVYQSSDEALFEVRNATVHAYVCSTLRPIDGGYRLYWGIYVAPVSWFTPVYMAIIEPFRRFVVYPAIFGNYRRAWLRRYGGAEPV